MPRRKLAPLLFVLLALAACATYLSSTKEARSDFYSGYFARAAQSLQAKSNEDSKDQLLYLLDRGTALQLAGDFKNSESDFLFADKMTEIKDYTSISTEAATLLTNDNLEQYKGEDFEKVLISAFLAIDYVLQGNYEDALVECRRVNEKLTKYRVDAKRNYEQNPFARYLSAMIWEASGHPDDAYIDYKMTAQLEPSFNYLKYDLTKLARRLGRAEDLSRWRSRYGEVAVPTLRQERSQGEIVLIYQQGRTAVKLPNPVSQRFPKFFPRPTFTQRARLEVTDTQLSELTYEIYSISQIAIKTLDDAYDGLVAKRLAGVAAKYIVAEQVAKKNEVLGILTWIGLNAADQADLRQWDTLPETLQLARLHVPPGNHTIRIVGLNREGLPTGETWVLPVKVAAGQIVFINWRSLL